MPRQRIGYVAMPPHCAGGGRIAMRVAGFFRGAPLIPTWWVDLS
jgi:hypothetical protein